MVAFYDLLFNQCKPGEGVECYVGDAYIYHNPGVAGGAAAFIEYFARMPAENPAKCAEFRHVIAQGDLVVLHCY